jgi:tetratricopeptide (TPR) repeat protein/predicted Ser/Thr protein kinase
MPQRAQNSDRTSRIQQIIEDCLSRRAGGEDVSNEQLIDSHPDLMPELRDELRKLALVERARAEAAKTARLPEAGSSELDDRFAKPLPDWFPGYDVVRELHRGGQGVVYQAIQKSTKRKVAIKVMREGPFAGPRDRSRFEREVQILGQLDHPGIVRIHESGTAAGNFFYVMDYISGQALDAYTAGDGRSIDATLRLFVKICQAVNAAHLRGVIHRDLKPSNIRIDSAGEPHVLDFGLAKLATQPLTDESQPRVMSLTGQFIGSLPWASPEQAEGSPEKIDTRTDVYSLGVILYQMLTGEFPYPVTGNMREVLDNILTAEPARPRTIRPQIDDEVETLVLKCLRKERERRYQTAGELARDVLQYLAGEPIDAKRDSAWYMLRKSVARYRVPAAVSGAFLALIVVFGVTMTLMYQHADRQARRAELYADFLENTLAALDPDTAEGQDTALLRELLDAAAGRVTELADQPEVEAAVRQTIGRTYLTIGLFGEAAAQLEGALRIRERLFGDRNLDMAETQYCLAWARKELGEFAAADTLYQEALATRQELLGNEHEQVADVLNGLGELRRAQGKSDQAESLLREALQMRRRLLGEQDPDVASSLACLGSLLRDCGRTAEAEEALRTALAIRREALGEHTHTAISLNMLGLLLTDTGAFSEAKEALEEALAMRRRLLPDNHPFIGTSVNNLALWLYARQDYAGAAPLFREAVERARTQPDDEQPQRLATRLYNLAATLHKLGDDQQAEPLCREALQKRREVLGPDHEDTAEPLYLLGKIRLEAGDLGAAERHLRESLSILEATRGADHPRTARVQYGLGDCLADAGHYEEAEPLLQKAYAGLAATLGSENQYTIAALKRLIEFYEARGLAERAEEYRARLPKPADTSPARQP